MVIAELHSAYRDSIVSSFLCLVFLVGLTVCCLLLFSFFLLICIQDGVPGRYVGVRPQPVFVRRLTSLVYDELALLPLWTCGLSAVLLLLLIGLSAEDNINLATVNMVLRLFTADKRRAVPVRMASAGLLLRVMVLVAQLAFRTLSTAANRIYTSCFRLGRVREASHLLCCIRSARSYLQMRPVHASLVKPMPCLLG